MKIRFAAAAAILAATPVVAKAPNPAALDRLIAGRTAGEAVPCIPFAQVRSSTVIDGTAIVYRIGSTFYVNRPRSGADALDQDDMLVDRGTTGRLCGGDTVHTQDPASGAYRATVILGEFVPYRRGG